MQWQESKWAIVKGKGVLLIDDGLTLTHGGMPFETGYVLAKQLEARESVNPQKHTKGSYISFWVPVVDKWR
jgi:predicted GTPase